MAFDLGGGHTWVGATGHMGGTTGLISLRPYH